MSSFQNFFVTRNVASQDMVEGFPWDFDPGDRLSEARAWPKEERRKIMLQPDTTWNVYSPVRGIAPNLRVSRGQENHPAGLRGVVADYDTNIEIPAIENYLSKVPPSLLPNFIEITLSGNIRLVWGFEKEVLVRDTQFCADLIETFFGRIRAQTLLPGYDKSSSKPAQVWTNGGQWFNVKDTPMDWKTVFGLVSDVSKKMQVAKTEIPFEIVHAEIEKRWPCRWQGPFELNSLGIRFWDAFSDCETGCQVKPDGMLCFTGTTPFMKWEAIFGAAWCSEQRAINLGNMAGETYFDGRDYWQFGVTGWETVERNDIILDLRNRGVSTATGRGETASEADKVLGHIQKMNRVKGAAPLVNYKPGLVTLDGMRILNTSSVRALEPAVKMATPENFPWIWKFINGLFDCADLKSTEHFLAWLQRSYSGALRYERLMGQSVFLCGPKENGKTLLCYRIIKPLLGNKIANPYDYFTGATTFNSDLFEAHLLALNDEEATSREETKQKFLARLKSFAVNPSQAYHPKFCNRINIEWTGRIFVTLNDDPSSVGLLPEMNFNTRDKLMFFGSLPYNGDFDGRNILEPKVAAELPFFARWLLDWKPPAEVLATGRMGVKSFFDPRIEELSKQQMFAYNLKELLEIWCKQSPYWAEENKQTEWCGTPSDLIQEFGILNSFQNVLREWTTNKVAKALMSLARNEDSGIKFVEGKGERMFKLLRTKLLRTRISP